MSLIREQLARARARGLSRRSFLKGGAAAGLALAFPGSLGCGGGGRRGDGARRTVHVDLSHALPASADRTAWLHAGGASYLLRPHDEESRLEARAGSSRLYGTEDAALTHFAEEVLLPEDGLQQLHVTAGDPTRDPDHRLLLSGLHVPAFARAEYARYRAERDGLGAGPTELAEVDDHVYLCHVDCAVSFVFHHPELCNLDPLLAPVFLAHIDPVDPSQRCTRHAAHRQEILDLAAEIARCGTAGYCAAEPLRDLDGSPLFWATDVGGERRLTCLRDGVPFRVMGFDAQGEPLPLEERDPAERTPAVSYRPRDGVLDKARAAVRAALNSAKNDPDLEGVGWTVVEGAAPVVRDDVPVTSLGADQLVPVRLDHEGGHDGLSFRLPEKTLQVGPDGNRSVTLEVKNYYLRYVGVFVRWLLADGSPDPAAAHHYGSGSAFGRPAWHVEVDRVVNGGFDAGGASVGHDPPTFFLGILPAVTAFAGVPEPPDAVRFSIPFPASSSKAEVIFASFGTGQARWATLPGCFLTGVINLGLPGYFLASGLWQGPAGKAILNKVVKNSALLEALVAAGLGMVAAGALGDAGTGLDTSYTRWAKSLGPVLVSSGCDALRYAIVAAATESAGERSVPFVGWALYVAGTAELVSDLAQTITEISCSDAVYRNRVNLTWKPTLRILPDPLNLRGGFPETATRYTVSVKFPGTQFHTWPQREFPLPSTTVESLDLTFDEIPAGGEATWTIRFYAGAGETLVGYASKRLVNWPVPEGDTTVAPELKDFTLVLEERAVPLTAATTYRQKDKLSVEDGVHRWLAHEDAGGATVSPPAPTATRADLDCSDTSPSMCAALGLTINQRARAAAYVWQSGGTSPACGGAGGGGQLRSVQNVSLSLNGHPGPEGFLRQPGCRYPYPGVAVAYDRMGTADGYHAFVEPMRIDGATHYLVRRLTLDAGLSFGGGQAVARLSGPPDAVAIHPGGFLVSVSRLLGKIEIADLAADPVPDARAPFARLAAGLGSRPGLLGAPVGLAVRDDGVVLVLESTHRRVSAFDVCGSVLRPFAGGSASFPLAADGGPATPLDLGVEGANHVYVLSHTGLGASVADYRLDLHQPDGTWLARTTGIAAARFAVDHFRNLVTLNFETVAGPAGVEPTLGFWVPSVPV